LDKTTSLNHHFPLKLGIKLPLTIYIQSRTIAVMKGTLKEKKIHAPNISSYNIFPEVDQIQEKKTPKSAIRNMSNNVSFIPSMSHLQKPYDNHYETQV